MHPFVTKALAALPLAHLALADHAVYTGSEFQDQDYGLYPVQSYVSSDQQAPIFQVNTPASDDVDSAPHVFISPRGTAVKQIAPMIFNADDLSLVWSDPSYGTTFGVRVQEFNNTDYITFWRGAIKSAGYGSGSYIMLDSNYNVAYNLTTKNLTVGGDIHEIQLTDEGTALMTAYEPMNYDLTSYGIEDGWLADSIFQEVDIATNDLIFSWRASDHFSTNDSYADPGSTGVSSDDPYDFFHINSIEKDDSGNYLISARHMHILAYINGTTGEVLWTLGGKNSDFSDPSGGNSTAFAWQHDARWQTPDLTQVTLFDNGAADWVATENATRGLWLTLNYTSMTVSLNHSYTSPEGILSVSQGSVQPLSNGNIFMGYGSNGAFIEYSPNGEEILWDVQFGILGNSSVQSYRAYKQHWTGYPTTNPAIAASGNATSNSTVYVSWNGATELKTWALLAGNTTDLSNNTALWKNVTRGGYETSVEVGTYARYIRAAALNADGEVLGSTDVVDMQSGDVTQMDTAVDLGTGSVDASGNTTAGNTTDKDSGAVGVGSGSATMVLGVVMVVLCFVGL